MYGFFLLSLQRNSKTTNYMKRTYHVTLKRLGETPIIVKCNLSAAQAAVVANELAQIEKCAIFVEEDLV